MRFDFFEYRKQLQELPLAIGDEIALFAQFDEMVFKTFFHPSFSENGKNVMVVHGKIIELSLSGGVFKYSKYEDGKWGEDYRSFTWDTMNEHLKKGFLWKTGGGKGGANGMRI